MGAQSYFGAIAGTVRSCCKSPLGRTETSEGHILTGVSVSGVGYAFGLARWGPSRGS